MTCSNCKHRFWLGTAGDGFSNPPGVFLFSALAGFVIAATGFTLLSSWSETVGLLVGVMGLVLGAGSLIIIPVAMLDAQAYGPCTCPQCGTKQTIYPWSI